MATQSIPVGRPVTLTQNVSYALPARLCFVTSSAALEFSNDESTWTALTGANTTGVNSGARFVRCPASTAVVRIVM
jgi:hypothetical protein